jgi:hypothetical protein
MFRTRDFILLFTCIVFLVAAIGATLFTQWFQNPDSSAMTQAGLASESLPAEGLVLTASIPTENDTARIERLNQMRDKIAAEPVLLVDEARDEVLPDDIGTTSDSESPLGSAGVIACSLVAPYLGFWDSRSLVVTSREGAVVVERATETGTEVVLQLPARTQPAATPTCIGSDVIGIATDGSLIRNDEMGLYGIFGSETLIGYALDGLPIYGASDIRGDVCGGRMVAGQYRYELSTARPTIIGCFAAEPVSLP